MKEIIFKYIFFSVIANLAKRSVFNKHWPETGCTAIVPIGSSGILGNTLGLPRYNQWLRHITYLTSDALSVFVGLLLGDGHIQNRNLSKNSRFIYAQSSLRINHFNYFNHILELFKPYLSKDFKLKERSFTDNRTNINYSSVQFATLSLPCFNYYKDIFYNSENLKIVPSNIENLLSPRGLAY